MFIPLLVLAQISFAQTQKQKDSLADEICKTIVETVNLPDTIRLRNAFSKHVSMFVSAYPDSKPDQLVESLFYRLQRNCPEVQKLLANLQPQKGDWAIVDEKPTTVLDNEGCKTFLKYQVYSYLETNGDTVHLEIKNGYWVEHFKDSSYSKLKLKKLNDCEFEIVFVESNNNIRKSFSKPGDKYKYQIVDKKENYFFMSTEVEGQNRFSTFKIYFIKP